MPDQNEVLEQYYDDVPLEDDYNLLVPEIVMLEDAVSDIEADPRIEAEQKVILETDKVHTDSLKLMSAEEMQARVAYL